jgi:hypothetical protein
MHHVAFDLLRFQPAVQPEPIQAGLVDGDDRHRASIVLLRKLAGWDPDYLQAILQGSA